MCVKIKLMNFLGYQTYNQPPPSFSQNPQGNFGSSQPYNANKDNGNQYNRSGGGGSYNNRSGGYDSGSLYVYLIFIISLIYDIYIFLKMIQN